MSNVKYLTADIDKVIESKLFYINYYCGDSHWELAKRTYSNDDERQSGKYGYFAIQVDDDRDISISVVCDGGFEYYNFEEFFNEDTIRDEVDLRLQEILLQTLNDLLDEGVVYFPRCTGVDCEYYTTHDYMASITMCRLTNECVKKGNACTIRESVNHYKDILSWREGFLHVMKNKQ